MKFGIFFVIGLCLISASALGELSVDDLDKIRDIVKESEDRLRAEIVAVEERLRSENAASETRTNKQLDRNFTLLVALFGFVAVVTGIPLTTSHYNCEKSATGMSNSTSNNSNSVSNNG